MNNSQKVLVSIIVIDYKKNNPYLKECLDAIQKQTYKNFEIILETDHKLKLNYPKLKIVDYAGKYISPTKKRDHGAKIAKGEILTFIDDDAYPDAHWLENIVPHFKDENISGVGGPGITPPHVSWKEEASGWASASPFGSGPYTYRFLAGNKQHIDDYPSMNLSVRKSDFEKVGGYDSNFWPGEDTKLCLDISFRLKKKIVYDPKAIVFHHRRPLWKGHLIQNGNFGLHRGFFVKILPETSVRLIYFAPSLIPLTSLFVIISLVFSNPLVVTLRHFALFMYGIYFIFLLINAVWILLKSKSLVQAVISIPTIFITHFWYGIRFIQGLLFTATLKR